MIMREREKFTPPVNTLEIEADSPEDLDKLSKILSEKGMDQEAIEQLIFLLQNISTQDFTNRCTDASKSFVHSAFEQFGGEESLAEIVPRLNGKEAQSQQHLNKTNYRGGHHSVGILEMPKLAIAVDPTCGTIRRANSKENAILIMISQTGTNQILVELEKYYGGSWHIAMRYIPEEGNFRSTVK